MSYFKEVMFTIRFGYVYTMKSRLYDLRLTWWYFTLT